MSLVDYPVINIAIGAAILAVIYGLVMSRWIINLPAGNSKMKAIAGAIQDGAAASAGDYIFEPSKEEIVLTLIPKSLKTLWFRAVLPAAWKDNHAW